MSDVLFNYPAYRTWKSNDSHNVLVSTFENGTEQRRYKRTNPRQWELQFVGKYDVLMFIKKFYNERQGRNDPFNWVPPGEAKAIQVRFDNDTLEIDYDGLISASTTVRFVEVLPTDNYDPTDVKVTAVTLYGTTQIKVGESYQLGLEVSPPNAINRDVTYTIEGNAAKVSQTGVVTGLIVGKVRIIATAKDGSGMSGNIAIEVVEAPTTPITYITDQNDVVIPFMGAPFLASKTDPSMMKGALYSMDGNLTDYFENFDRSTIVGNNDTTYLDKTTGYILGALKAPFNGYVQTPTTTASIYYEDLLNVNGVHDSPDSEFFVGTYFKPDYSDLEAVPILGVFTGASPSEQNVYKNLWGFYLGAGEGLYKDGLYYVEVINGYVQTCHKIATKTALTNRIWHNVAVRSVIRDTGHFKEVLLDGEVVLSEAYRVVPGDPSRTTPIYLGGHLSKLSNITKSLSGSGGVSKWNLVAGGTSFTTDSTGTIMTAASNTGHKGCPITSVIPLGNTSYCWELEYVSGQYLWIGLAEPYQKFDQSAALIGWVFSTHNGRIWNHQTGGGTNFKAAIPVGSVISLVYEGDTHRLTVYVGGTLWGSLPYIIDGPVVPFVGTNGACQIKIRSFSALAKDPSWNDLPQVDMFAKSEDFSFHGYFKWFNVMKGTPLNTQFFDLQGNEQPQITVKGTTYDGTVITARDITDLALKWEPAKNQILSICPNVPTGNYSFETAFSSGNKQVSEKCKILNFENLLVNKAYVMDLSNEKTLIKDWYATYKKWGAGNNGTIPGQVKIDVRNQKLFLEAHGDDHPDSPRTGACLVSQHYFTPGRFDVVAKCPVLTGACCAIWPFHYEEAYPGHTNYEEMLLDYYISTSGTDEDGYYIVRNNEVDIETPTALMGSLEPPSFQYGRFNTWIGEQDIDYVPKFLPFFEDESWICDGNYHKFTMDWDSGEYIKFYVDDRFITEITKYDSPGRSNVIPTIPMRLWFGVWFPKNWAGVTAPWASQYFIIKSFQFTPNNSPFLSVGESYPQDGVRLLEPINFETPMIDVSLIPTHLTLKAGETAQVTPKFESEGRYSYSLVSLNPEIATIDNTGLVTAIAEGDARLAIIVSAMG